MDRIVIVPRWSGDASSDWYPWLRGKVAAPVEIASLLPSKDAPEIAACIDDVTPLLDETVTLIGHSVGAQVAMRALAQSGVRVPHLLLVAGWWTVDKPWDAIRPWIDTPFDESAVHADRVTVLLSDDDPFTAEHAETRRLFESRLGAKVELCAGARHFNNAEEPAVLTALA